jgi:hypothetical protein
MSHAYAKMPEETQTVQQRPSETQEAPASRPPVACAAPAGEAQGGLLDWFRGLFGGGQQNSQTPDTLNAGLLEGEAPQAPSQQPEVEQAAPQQMEAPQGEQPQQWVDTPNGQVNPDFVTTEPDKDNMMYDWVQPYPHEGVAQAPVFETHTILPSMSTDGRPFTYVHSFVGLRFTQFDPATQRLARKRIKAGLCGDGLANNNGYMADMSTETPITPAQLKYAFQEMPRLGSRPYDLFTFNCNHFTQQMAEKMGAEVPAQLHDHLLGPVSAYTDMANAAEKGPQGRTRFFQGGAADTGKMASDKCKDFVKDFVDAAKSAARWDGLPFALYSQLPTAAQAVRAAADPMIEHLPTPKFSISKNEMQALETSIQNTKDRANELIHLHLWKGHPRVTIVTMKVIAIADRLYDVIQPQLHPEQRRTLSSYTNQEIDSSFALSGVEEFINSRTLPANANTNAAVFQEIRRFDDEKNEPLATKLGRSMNSAGDILLQAANLDPLVLVHTYDTTDSRLKPAKCLEMLTHINDTLSQASIDSNSLVAQYYDRFLAGREKEPSAQLGALATQAMLGCLKESASGTNLWAFLSSLKNATNDIASLRADDRSLENDQTNERVRNKMNGYAGIQPPKTSADEQQNTTAAPPEVTPSQQTRMNILYAVNSIERNMARIFEARRNALAAGQDAGQSPQEQDAASNA